MSFAIDFRWVDAGPSADRLSAATMADLRITLDGRPLTSHIDRRTRSHGDEITVPLYPLAEWMTSWWWAILHEYGSSVAHNDSEYLQRHDIAHAGSGFVYPSVLLQPTGRLLEVRSQRVVREHSAIEFLVETAGHVDLDAAEGEFAKLIAAVIERLDLVGISGSVLQGDWEAMGALDADEIAFCEAAGRFGLDAFELEDRDASAVVHASRAVDPLIRDDLFSLVPPALVEALNESVHQDCAELEQRVSGSAWAHLASHELPAWKGMPWEVGYCMARWARQQLGLSKERVDFDGEREVATAALGKKSPPHLNGVVASTSPACAIRHDQGHGRRFTVARAVGAYLVRKGHGPSLLTSMRTDQQSQTRAFAAEFLVPAAGIRQRIGDRPDHWINEETIDDLADEFDVSSFVVAHQIQNHGLGRVGT